MTFELLTAFMMYAFVGSITPGPNNMMVLTSGLNYGIRPTLPHIAGIVVGFGLMIFLGGMGLLSVLDHVPFLYQLLHMVSVTYLLYLAWKIASASPIDSSKAAHKKPMTFLQAVAFQWVNPKALVMVMAALTTYVPKEPEADFLFNVTVVSLLYALITLPCVSVWAIFGKGFRHFLKNPLYCRIFNVTMAILLVLSLYPLLSEIKI